MTVCLALLFASTLVGGAYLLADLTDKWRRR